MVLQLIHIAVNVTATVNFNATIFSVIVLLKRTKDIAQSITFIPGI